MAAILTIPAWTQMWAIAFAIFFAAKLATWAAVLGSHGLGWTSGYLFGWPGMDANAFLARRKPEIDDPTLWEWSLGFLRVIVGVLILSALPRLLISPYPSLAAWSGMIGIVMTLHFGLFQLLSCGWRSVGIAAAPLMQHPFESHSLSEFWGRRWNTAFRDLTHQFVFRPTEPQDRGAARIRRRISAERPDSRRRDLLARWRRIWIADPLFRNSGRRIAVGAFSHGPSIADESRLEGPAVLCRGRVVTRESLVSCGFPGKGHSPDARCMWGAAVKIELANAIFMVGIFQIGILIASALVPIRLDWMHSLANLPTLLRQMYWVYGGYVVLSIISLGLICLVNSRELAQGGMLARSFCGYAAAFWAIRLGLQAVFSARPFLTTWWLKAGYHLLTPLFAANALILGWAAIH